MNALEGLRILDFSRVLAGPFCTMLLADFGADVIKVEHPQRGDDTRHWHPPIAGELSAYFLSVNRNKRSLTLDLKTAEGQEIAHQLALKSDVVIENFKVDGLKPYKLDYHSLKDAAPHLVYCSITGYGQDSPYSNRPGYDYVIQGQSGLMSITGQANGEPHKVGVAIADVLTGLFAANAIQTALLHREQTGDGQYIDIALLDAQIAALVNVASNYLISDKTPPRHGNAHPNIVPYEAVPSKDGMFIVAVGNDKQFRACCNVIGQPNLADNPNYATNPARVANRTQLMEILNPIFQTQSTTFWIEKLLAAGVPSGEINDIPAALNTPHAKARHLVESVELADGTIAKLLAPIQKLSKTPPDIHTPPPILGQHTDQILKSILGYNEEKIATYRNKGII